MTGSIYVTGIDKYRKKIDESDDKSWKKIIFTIDTWKGGLIIKDLPLLEQLVIFNGCFCTKMCFNNVPSLKKVKIILKQRMNIDISGTSIESLDVSSNRVRNIIIEGSSETMKEIKLHDVIVSDYSFIKRFPNLETLSVINCSSNDRVTNHISDLTRLQRFIIEGISGECLPDMSRLKDLKEIDISRTEITSLEPLACLRLDSLCISETCVADISCLSDQNLERFIANETPIKDFSCLEHMDKLKDVSLCDARIKDISFLANKNNLEYLRITDNNMYDIGPLASCPNLRTIDISRTFVYDIKPLKRLLRLESLRACYTYVIYGHGISFESECPSSTIGPKLLKVNVDDSDIGGSLDEIARNIIIENITDYASSDALNKHISGIVKGSNDDTDYVFLQELLAHSARLFIDHEHNTLMIDLLKEDLSSKSCYRGYIRKVTALIGIFYPKYTACYDNSEIMIHNTIASVRSDISLSDKEAYLIVKKKLDEYFSK